MERVEPTRLRDSLKGWARRMPLPHGFRFAETMEGSALINGQKRDMSFRIEARAEDLVSHVKTGETQISGTVFVAGLAQDAALTGSLWIRPRSIRYGFSFRDDGGRLLRFSGQKDLRLFDLPRRLTTLPGEILDEEGNKVASALLHFPIATLWAFLQSFQPL